MISNKHAKYLKFMGIDYNADDNFKEVIKDWSNATPFGPIKLLLSIPVSWVIRITVKDEIA